MYTVPKIADYSPETLDRAAAEAVAAFHAEQKAALEAAKNPDMGMVERGNAMRAFRDRWVARKNGVLTQINELWLKRCPGESKRNVGQKANYLRAIISAGVEDAERDANFYLLAAPDVLRKLATNDASALGAADGRLAFERLDISLPGIHRPIGVKHPVLRVMDEIVAVFKAMGYSVGEGPEVETDYYNFESLNFPPNHPARDTQDTLFIAGQESKPARDRLMLRTHTSPVQIRTMEQQPPPVRIIIPGKVHRNDPLDATHSPVFHQVEGLAVDTNITFCDLKGTLDHAVKALFGSSVKTRFYPSFFPFTEPSADMQVSCIFCGGKGCRKCKFSGWIELLGCGMVDPNVFDFVKQNGYDSSKVSGFAFGMGVERIALLKYEVEGIQLFYEGDVRFLEQFA
ncbi:MAG: phenylalanine--tRNA ligase subunit alpha [Candidatus Korobacteraceae bacterium]